MSDNQEHTIFIYSTAHSAGYDVTLHAEDSRATINTKVRSQFGVAPDSHVHFTDTAGNDIPARFSILGFLPFTHVFFEFSETHKRPKNDREMQVAYILEDWEIKDIGEALPPDLWPRQPLPSGAKARREHNAVVLPPSSWSQQVLNSLAQLSRITAGHPEWGWEATREAVRQRYAREGKYKTSTNIDTAVIEAMPVDLRLAATIIEERRRANREERSAERRLEMDTLGERVDEVGREIQEEDQAGGGVGSEPFTAELPMRPRK